ncbi:MAG: hypothetical protein ACI31R_03170 [Bacilli bacterium]
MIVKILCYVVPAILILMLSIDIFKIVMSGEDNVIKTNMRMIVKRIIFAVAIFFVPMIVNIAFGLLGDMQVSAADCYNNATPSGIESAKKEEASEYEAYKAKVKAEKDAEIKKEKEEEQKRIKANASSSSNATSTSSNGGEAITKIAFETAWPISQRSNSTKKATSAFTKYLDQVYPNHNKWGKCANKGRSCDVYVGIVIRASGYDKNVPRGLAEQIPYYEKSSKWKKINTGNTIKESQLQSGDIFTYSHSGGSGGHTFIYLKKGNVGYRAEASYCGSSAGYYGRLSKYKSPKTNKLRVFRAVK